MFTNRLWLICHAQQKTEWFPIMGHRVLRINPSSMVGFEIDGDLPLNDSINPLVNLSGCSVRMNPQIWSIFPAVYGI